MKEIKVKVIKNVLGLVKGDTLILDAKTNDYVFNNTDVFEGVATIANTLTESKKRVSLSKGIVEDSIGEYFEYVKPEPVLKTVTEIEKMIKDHQDEYNIAYNKLYGDEEFNFDENRAEVKERLTVHWNIIKILEWSLGY